MMFINIWPTDRMTNLTNVSHFRPPEVVCQLQVGENLNKITQRSKG